MTRTYAKYDTYTAYAVLMDGTQVTIYSLYKTVKEASEAADKFADKYRCSETWVQAN